MPLLLEVEFSDLEKQIYQETGCSVYEIKKALRQTEGNKQEAMKILAERYHAGAAIKASQPQQTRQYRIEA